MGAGLVQVLRHVRRLGKLSPALLPRDGQGRVLIAVPGKDGVVTDSRANLFDEANQAKVVAFLQSAVWGKTEGEGRGKTEQTWWEWITGEDAHKKEEGEKVAKDQRKAGDERSSAAVPAAASARSAGPRASAPPPRGKGPDAAAGVAASAKALSAPARLARPPPAPSGHNGPANATAPAPAHPKKVAEAGARLDDIKVVAPREIVGAVMFGLVNGLLLGLGEDFFKDKGGREAAQPTRARRNPLAMDRHPGGGGEINVKKCTAPLVGIKDSFKRALASASKFGEGLFSKSKRDGGSLNDFVRGAAPGLLEDVGVVVAKIQGLVTGCKPLEERFGSVFEAILSGIILAQLLFSSNGGLEDIVVKAIGAVLTLVFGLGYVIETAKTFLLALHDPSKQGTLDLTVAATEWIGAMVAVFVLASSRNTAAAAPALKARFADSNLARLAGITYAGAERALLLEDVVLSAKSGLKGKAMLELEGLRVKPKAPSSGAGAASAGSGATGGSGASAAGATRAPGAPLASGGARSGVSSGVMGQRLPPPMPSATAVAPGPLVKEVVKAMLPIQSESVHMEKAAVGPEEDLHKIKGHLSFKERSRPRVKPKKTREENSILIRKDRD